MNPLEEYRQRLDDLDTELIKGLAERFKITQKVGAYKAEHSLPEVDPAREEDQMLRIDALAAAAGLRPEVARAVLRLVIDLVVEEHKALRKRDLRGR